MIRIITFGKIKESYLIKLIDDYKLRISKYHKIEIIELKDENNLQKEALNLQKYLNRSNYLIVLAIEGKQITSLEFSKKIEEIFLSSYGNIDFVIGSSEGIDVSIKSMANELISFSKMTFPHGLFRGILLEQIYRAFKIVNNETYHK